VLPYDCAEPGLVRISSQTAEYADLFNHLVGVRLMIPILFLALAQALTPLAAQGLSESEADNLREVAFKTLIREAAEAQNGFKVYFLCLGDTWTNDTPSAIDPSDTFMARFAGRTPPVKKVSQSKKGEAGQVFDKITGQRGVIFTVDDLKWISDEEVEATCSVYKAGLDGYAYKYILNKKNNRWNVAKKTLWRVS